MNWKSVLPVTFMTLLPLYLDEIKEGHYYGIPAMISAGQNGGYHQMYLHPPEQLDDGWHYTKYTGYIATTQPINFREISYIYKMNVTEDDIREVQINQVVPNTGPVDTTDLLKQITQMELQSASARLQLRSLYLRVEDDPDLKKLVETAINQVTAVENRTAALRTLTENLGTE